MPTGLTRESPVACGLALPEFVEPVGITGRGLTQQKIDRLPELEVGVGRPLEFDELVERFTQDRRDEAWLCCSSTWCGRAVGGLRWQQQRDSADT